LRRRKSELDEIRKGYEHGLFSENQLDKASQMAELAARLGRPFESRHWALLASVPTGQVARVDQESLATAGSSTLADLLPEIAGPASGRAVEANVADRSKLHFSDDAESAGLRFVQENGAAGRLIPPVTSSGGVGLIDIDNDGWLDVFVVQGGPFP